MNFRELFDFLTELNKNNHKEWMDENRKWYFSVRDNFIAWLDEMNIRLSQIDSEYSPNPGRKSINRINNNLLYHPNKPIYKDHFGAGLDIEKATGDFYVHLGINECFLAGGFYKPQKKYLDSIRAAIDYNGEEFKKIVDKPSFKEMFGALMEDEKLKTSPKGYSIDHKHIDLLVNKSFAVSHKLAQKEVVSSEFDDTVLRVYREMLPFRRYLNNAVSV
ncbi:DUF2461 domain-containing protein [Gramella sp. AN32]|uniref:DUF2461 domain-containing protein n=1 Tax=Christiangramia antarctica TaxID=2058158 RepID=A0ABW5X3X1_9FLAO|nr:DUF2461 domain-containing protein [Gramella sp. AN32]MCM4157853.1 TIGR02453 family protein [Gramella sp. AN32]